MSDEKPANKVPYRLLGFRRDQFEDQLNTYLIQIDNDGLTAVLEVVCYIQTFHEGSEAPVLREYRVSGGEFDTQFHDVDVEETQEEAYEGAIEDPTLLLVVKMAQRLNRELARRSTPTFKLSGGIRARFYSATGNCNDKPCVAASCRPRGNGCRWRYCTCSNNKCTCSWGGSCDCP
ncbi:MAG: hypothetical protein SF029_06600 [bacterium]|nr:hypothetical protein [bacterium]